MASVRDYVDAARVTDPDTFRRRVGAPVLVQLAGTRTKARDTKSGEHFNTQVMLDYQEMLAIAQGRKLDPTARVFSVVKQQGRNPFAGMVAIGRADNCDVAVLDDDVSKFHAYLAHDPADPDRFVLADASSSNGTYLNEQRLPAGQNVPVQAGDKIRLGAQLVLQFFPPNDFWGALNAE